MAVRCHGERKMAQQGNDAYLGKKSLSQWSRSYLHVRITGGASKNPDPQAIARTSYIRIFWKWKPSTGSF